MRALVLERHGNNEAYRLVTDFPDPVCGPDEVVLRVGATSLNYHDVFTRRGMEGIKIPLPMICGLDVAGEIVEVGSHVEGWDVGNRVLADPRNRAELKLLGETQHGGLAELCRVHHTQLHRLPADVTYEQAAALPVAYGTAYRMMFARGQVGKGDRVLILGASGGVGTCCLQLAKLQGATVTVCASSAGKLDALTELGADHTINYAEQDFVDAAWAIHGKPRRHDPSQGFDVVVNFTGGDTWVNGLRCARVGGKVLTCGATAGYDPPTDLRYIWTFELLIIGSNAWLPDDLDRLLELVQSGELRPVIGTTLQLEEATEGIRMLEEREVSGKIVVTP
jgi:alcohol dehydrogenase